MHIYLSSNFIGTFFSNLHTDIATEEVGYMLVFFGGQSAFLNFHKSKFMVKGVTYDCNKRFYVRSKAVFAEDMDPINAVMSADTPQNIKLISDALNSKINIKR